MATSFRTTKYALLSEEDKGAIGRDGYVSEGLVKALKESRKGEYVVLSSGALGPTWFPSDLSATFSGHEDLKTGGPLRVFTDTVKVVPHLDPTWVLSEEACDLLTSFDFLKQVPVLNILNGFEILMRHLMRTRMGRLVANTTEDKHFVIGRVRVLVSFMCYSLIDTLKWKKAMSAATAPSFVSVPSTVDYEELMHLIRQRCQNFADGRADDTTVSGTDEKTYAVATLMTLVSIMVSLDDVAPSRFLGSFYDAVFGHDIMSRLAVVVSGEYRSLLARTEQSPKELSRLDRLVSDIDRLTPSQEKEYDGIEKEWAKLESRRRANGTRTPSRKAIEEELLPRGVSVRPRYDVRTKSLDTSAVDSLIREVEDEAAGARPHKEAVDRIFIQTYSRVVFHSNFDVSYNSYYTYYTLWNWLFIGSGGLFFTGGEPATRALMANLIFNDFDKLLGCVRCSSGFKRKITESYQIVRKLTDEAMAKLLGFAVETLTDDDDDSGGKRPGGPRQLLKKIAAYIPRHATSFKTTKLRLLEADRKIEQMQSSEVGRYALRSREASKGFAILFVYFLGEACPESETVIGTRDDRSVVMLLNRWSRSKYEIGDEVVNDKGDARLLSFASIWSLRNAVRTRRDVSDHLNIRDSYPGRALSLYEAFRKNKHRVRDFLAQPAVADFSVGRVKEIFNTLSSTLYTVEEPPVEPRGTKLAKAALLASASRPSTPTSVPQTSTVSEIAVSLNTLRNIDEDVYDA